MISRRQTHLYLGLNELYTATARYALASPSCDHEVVPTKPCYHQQVNPVKCGVGGSDRVRIIQYGGPWPEIPNCTVVP